MLQRPALDRARPWPPVPAPECCGEIPQRQALRAGGITALMARISDVSLDRSWLRRAGHDQVNHHDLLTQVKNREAETSMQFVIVANPCVRYRGPVLEDGRRIGFHIGGPS